MSTPQVVVLIIAVAVIVAALLAFGAVQVRRRELRRRFGPEYDRALAESDGKLAAERELRSRERRHAELDVKPLSDTARDKYLTQWREVQARFVDDPAAAVAQGDELVTRLVSERGYPTEDYDDQLATLSVDHARVLGNYRDAHDIKLRNDRGEASTEQLRQALVHYRELFADLVGVDNPVSGSQDATRR